MSRFIECDKHGQSRRAVVCKHLVQTLSDQIPRGVIWLRDDDGCVNGYCDDCTMMLEDAGGEWNDELEAKAGLMLICEGCFRRVLSINKRTELN
jgi:hypothetical protein